MSYINSFSKCTDITETIFFDLAIFIIVIIIKRNMKRNVSLDTIKAVVSTRITRQRNISAPLELEQSYNYVATYSRAW